MGGDEELADAAIAADHALGRDPLDEVSGLDADGLAAELGEKLEAWEKERESLTTANDGLVAKVRALENELEVVRTGTSQAPDWTATDRSRELLLQDISSLLDEAWEGISESVERSAGIDPTKLAIAIVWKADDEGVECKIESKFTAAKETRTRRAKFMAGQLELL